MLAIAALLLAATPAHAQLSLQPIDANEAFAGPVYAASPPGDASRVFVVERSGVIQLVLNGEKQDTAFLTIPEADDVGEGGLLGLAFAPDYAATGLFYVFVTPDDANPGASPFAPIEIREYRRSSVNQNLADAGSAREVLEIPHPDHTSHYGGTLQFGPDGLLYIGTGDGGGAGDPGDNAQDTTSPLGKILRLGPREDGGQPYTLPASNPFAAGVGGHPLVYSYGLRNPFRFSFDRATGDLTIGDVGQDAFEEIDFAATAQGRGRGANFGWDSCEGFVVYGDPTTPCGLSGDTLPAHAYPHAPPGCSGSVTGGVVVRDPALPTLAGRYLYGDFCRDFVRSICLPSGSGDAPSGLTVTGPVAFGEDGAGRVLVVQIGGSVARLAGSSNAARCPSTAPLAIPLPARPSASVAFSLTGALRQRPLRSGNIGVRVRCSGPCSARALGRLSLTVRGKRIRLRQALGKRAGAGTLTLKLRLPAKARGPLRGALRAAKRVTAALTIRVRDGAGRLTVRQRSVRLAR